VIKKGPMYGNLKLKQLSFVLRVAHSEKSEVKLIVKKFSNNILDDVKREKNSSLVFW